MSSITIGMPDFLCGFFNSVNHDRLYTNMEISMMFDGIITEGVYQTIGTALMVDPSPNGGLEISVGIGRARFNHTWSYNRRPMILNIEEPGAIFGRIDAVVLEVDTRDSYRNNAIKIIKGESSSSPKRPTLAKSSEDLSLNQYPLAYITLEAGQDSIERRHITNMVGTSSTPFVTGVLKGMDIDKLIEQWGDQWEHNLDIYEGVFLEWFDRIKGQLSDDLAGHLQNQIDGIRTTLERVDDEVHDYDGVNRNIIYVSSWNGDDKWGDGTIDNPYRTLKKAISKAPIISSSSVMVGSTLALPTSTMIAMEGGSYFGDEASIIIYKKQISFSVYNNPNNVVLPGPIIIRDGGYAYFVSTDDVPGENWEGYRSFTFSQKKNARVFDLANRSRVEISGCWMTVSSWFDNPNENAKENLPSDIFRVSSYSIMTINSTNINIKCGCTNCFYVGDYSYLYLGDPKSDDTTKRLVYFDDMFDDTTQKIKTVFYVTMRSTAYLKPNTSIQVNTNNLNPSVKLIRVYNDSILRKESPTLHSGIYVTGWDDQTDAALNDYVTYTVSGWSLCSGYNQEFNFGTNSISNRGDGTITGAIKYAADLAAKHESELTSYVAVTSVVPSATSIPANSYANVNVNVGTKSGYKLVGILNCRTNHKDLIPFSQYLTSSNTVATIQVRNLASSAISTGTSFQVFLLWQRT